MQVAANIETARRWFTAGWLGKVDAADVFDVALVTNGVAVGIGGPRANVNARLAAFPNLRTDVMTLRGDEDTVTVQVRWIGTHVGAYGGVMPTGKCVGVRVISIWRFAAGKVVEIWTLQDQFSLLQQVGYLPAGLTAAQVTLDTSGW